MSVFQWSFLLSLSILISISTIAIATMKKTIIIVASSKSSKSSNVMPSILIFLIFCKVTEKFALNSEREKIQCPAV